jgi:hypothetical protein
MVLADLLLALLLNHRLQVPSCQHGSPEPQWPQHQHQSNNHRSSNPQGNIWQGTKH